MKNYWKLQENARKGKKTVKNHEKLQETARKYEKALENIAS